jgi:hypothetical protein
MIIYVEGSMARKKEGKAVPQHTYEGRGGIAPIHS